jgi:uncharacterized protein YeaO (DUF488 family)
MGVRVKRVYDERAAGDGVRVLVDRLWPRGLTKEAAGIRHWLKDLAPSNDLRQWYHRNEDAWAMFRRRYLRELASEDASSAVEKLHGLATGKQQLTLVYASRNRERNNATVLKELLEGMKKPPSSVGAMASVGKRVGKTKKS